MTASERLCAPKRNQDALSVLDVDGLCWEESCRAETGVTMHIVLPWAAVDQEILAECPNVASGFLIAVYCGKLALYSLPGFVTAGGDAFHSPHASQLLRSRLLLQCAIAASEKGEGCRQVNPFRFVVAAAKHCCMSADKRV